MEFVKNVPFFCIMLCMVSAVISSMLPRKAARWITVFLSMAVAVMNLWLLCFLLRSNESFTYMMGHFPAPWGNELRGGLLEALMTIVFSLVILSSALGGMDKQEVQIDEAKQNLFSVMLDLVLAGMVSMVYTNDLFTGYVFIEILTLASCVLIMARQNGRTMVSATRYMIMSLLGSGLITIGITITYSLTGHLLMENIHESMVALHQSGSYEGPITVVIGLFFVGVGIKSALFPFHTWLADAYSYSTPAASSILSSVVSKTYIFFLIKILYRTIGFEVIRDNRVLELMFLFGIAAMIFGSLSAISSHDLRRMCAFSSVAQIGYIYAAMGLTLEAGFVAALYHMLVHSLAKSSMFIAASSLSDVSGNSKRFSDLRGAGFRHRTAGVCFTVSAMSIVGIPPLGGFISKLYFGKAAFAYGGAHMWVMLLALALSTLLNVLYFMKTVITLYRPARHDFENPDYRPDRRANAAMWLMTAANLLAGFLAQPIADLVHRGLAMFV
ncbi:MAG: sodium:proton antiporter [Clostridiales bacterium]|nr:sodium:proton antiporter [Clostridiales bacterium]